MSLRGSQVAVSCVTENSPRMLAQALRLVRSIRWFGGELSQSRVLVCAVGGMENGARRELEALGAEIRIITRFHPANPTANRLQTFAQMQDGTEALWLMLDCDTIVVQDPLPFLSGDAFQAKIAPVPTVTETVFARLFAHFNLPLPPPSHVTGFTGTPTIPYYNGGVLAMPPAIARELAPVWRRYNQELADEPRLVDPCRRHMHQASLSLALVATGVPQRELSAALNFQLNATHMEPPPGFAETDPVIVHYHQFAGDDGQLLPCPYPLAQERIETFNARLREEGLTTRNRADVSHTLVVLGMHRSGTSVVTEIVRAMGAYAGESDEMPAPDMFNPTGYWEHHDVQKLNTQILERLGVDWIAGAAADLSRLSVEERAQFTRRAREVAAPLTVIKVPTMAILFPIWRDALERPLCILAWRDPISVARSLANRDNLPPQLGLTLWELYTRAMLIDTRGLPRVLVSYDALVRDPVPVVKELYERLRVLGVRGLVLPADETLRQIVNPDFNRSSVRGEAEADSLLDPEQSELLETLLNESAVDGEVSQPSPRTRAHLMFYTDLLRERQLLHGRVALAERQVAERTLLIEGILQSRSWKIGYALTRLLRAFRGGELSAEDRWRAMK